MANRIRIKDLETSSNSNSIILTNVSGEPRYFTLNYKKVVDPTIMPTWNVFVNDQVTPWPELPTSSQKHIIVETGCQVNPAGYYTYPDASTERALPDTVSGSWGVTLPGPNTASASLFPYTVWVTADTTYSVTLSKEKTGLTVIDGFVTVPTDTDDSMDSMSVKFLPAGYFGTSALTVLTGTDIQQLGNKMLQDSQARNIYNFTSGSEYTYYCYPLIYGPLNNIIQNDSLPILGAFERLSNVSMTSDTGETIVMIVYKSNSTDAFTNVTLNFS